MAPCERRDFLRLIAGTVGLSLLPAAPTVRAGPALGAATPFSAATLRERARALAAAPYRAPTTALPAALERLDYDAFRDIRYVREEDLWYGEHDFNIEFFHLGYGYREPVRVHRVADGAAAEILYSPELFDFGGNDIAGALEGVEGFAGVRILYPLNTTAYKDELGVFLGASYFRLLGETMLYGLSARGLAIDTAGAGAEEFPIFRELYFEEPEEPDRLVMHALLDSPSVAGAYRFVIRPGTDTVMETELALYPRVAIEGVGIAPLTSMFLFAPNDRQGVDDFREAVHDSNGLLMHSGTGEWLWRPVTNPEALQLSAFTDPNVRGFGLMQRERRFTGYHDLEARYERRPSAWVEPLGDWGPGQVVLAELDAPDETYDNLVAFWRPEAPLAAGGETTLRYRLHWCLEVPSEETPWLRVAATRAGSGASIGVDPAEDAELGTRLFMIDFVEGGRRAEEAGSDADAGADGGAKAGGRRGGVADAGGEGDVEAVVTASGGTVSTVTTEYNEPLRAWRTYFRVRADGVGGAPGTGGGGTDAPAPDASAPGARAPDAPVEIRCFLRAGETALSETWLYRWDARAG